jgi:TPR repeat protein
VFWQSIEKSSNPGDFEAYLQQFPNGVFSPLARVRLAALTSSPPPQRAVAKVPEADEMSWSDADRRSVQSALTALGDYQGPINGGFATSMMRSAVLHWQTLEGVETTGHLSIEQHDRILRDADAQAVLLKVPALSPRGKPANSLRGAETRFNRGVAFDTGTGQSKDPAEAAYWYALAASDGWRGAYTNLGMLYAIGQGVRQDLQAARRLWLTAATLGDGVAMFNLGTLAETGYGGQPADLAEARRWYSRGAETRHAESAAALQRLGG